MAWSITEVARMPGVTSRTLRADAYRGPGRLYVDDERFQARYDKIIPGLAAYQRDAMTVYARDRLS